jgi:hypothetical protein
MDFRDTYGCYIDRRKAKREGRGATVAVSAGEKGEGKDQRRRQQKTSGLFLYVYSLKESIAGVRVNLENYLFSLPHTSKYF